MGEEEFVAKSSLSFTHKPFYRHSWICRSGGKPTIQIVRELLIISNNKWIHLRASHSYKGESTLLQAEQKNLKTRHMKGFFWYSENKIKRKSTAKESWVKVSRLCPTPQLNRWNVLHRWRSLTSPALLIMLFRWTWEKILSIELSFFSSTSCKAYWE